MVVREDSEESPSDGEEDASTLLQSGFWMDVLAEFCPSEKGTKQQAILHSTHSEVEVQANHRFLREAALEVD